MKKIATLGLLVTLTVLFSLTSSCSTADDAMKETQTWAIQRESAYFETKILDITSLTADQDLIYRFTDSCASEDQIALLLTFSKVNSMEPVVAEIILMDSEGVEVSEISLGQAAPGFTPTAMEYTADNTLAVLGTTEAGASEIRIVSGSDGTISRTIPLADISFYVSDFSPIPNGWVLLGYNDIAFTDDSGQSYFSEPLQMSLSSDLIVGENSVCLLGYINDSVLTLETIQFDQPSIKTLSGAQIPFLDDVNRMSFFLQDGYANYEGAGIYKFNFDKKTVCEIADWNRIDLPPTTSLGTSGLSVLNDDTMIRYEFSTDGTSSDKLILLKHRDADPNANKKVITIGGYSARTALMEQAIYRYNTGEHDCRVQLVDYNDLYPFSDAAELAQANAEIISAMSNGKGDDMYTGLEMNYDAWGRNGLLMDLSEFLTEDPNIDMDRYLSILSDTSESNGKLYKVFPAFSFCGYVGYQDKIGKGRELTVSRVLNLSDTLQPDQTMFPPVFRENLGIGTLLYRFDSYLTDDGFSISEKDFADILNFADSFGFSDITSVQDINIGQAYVTGQLLFQEAIIGSPMQYWNLEQSGTSEMVYYGVPSVYDSARICSPDTMIGISTGTDEPEECREFIEVLLSEEVQNAAVQNGKIPVLKSAFENQITQAMTPEEGENAPKPMTEESAQRYRESVNSLNCFMNVDINLWCIFRDEIQSNYVEGKSIPDVREIMINRVNTYIEEVLR